MMKEEEGEERKWREKRERINTKIDNFLRRIYLGYLWKKKYLILLC